MSAFEDRLAELLAEEKARIEQAVALVQRAADAWVQAFREQAEKMVKDPKSQYAFMPTPVTAVEVTPIPANDPDEETPPHMRVPETAQAVINGMVGRQWRAGDEDAINANMKI